MKRLGADEHGAWEVSGVVDSQTEVGRSHRRMN